MRHHQCQWPSGRRRINSQPQSKPTNAAPAALWNVGERDGRAFQSLPRMIIDKQWQTFHLFGEEDVAEGGGARPFLGLGLNDGKVYGLDVERDRSPMFLLNSDIDRFVKTFRPFDIPDLPSQAAAIDPDAYAASEWRLLADYLLPDRRRIRCRRLRTQDHRSGRSSAVPRR
jgi:hypothetical protein